MRVLAFAEITIVIAAFALLAPAAQAESRDPADIAGTIDQHKAEITAIYNTYLEAGLEFEGTVVVRFTIARTGAVTASEVAEAYTDCKLFEEAVAAAVMRWDFGPAAGEPVTVRYPFAFTIPPPTHTP